jgi:four helix bundle protein
MEEVAKKFDLEERLIAFSLSVITIAEMLPKTQTGNYLANQVLRSGTSPALNYGEAQVAESREDFIHKMKICLKELKETNVSLQLIKRKPLVTSTNGVDSAIEECRELISIFVKSIETARKNKALATT